VECQKRRSTQGESPGQRASLIVRQHDRPNQPTNQRDERIAPVAREAGAPTAAISRWAERHRARSPNAPNARPRSAQRYAPSMRFLLNVHRLATARRLALGVSLGLAACTVAPTVPETPDTASQALRSALQAPLSSQAPQWLTLATSGDPDPASARAQTLLSQPLSADGAVELALLQSPAVAALRLELDFALAQSQQARTLANPGLHWGVTSGDGGPSREWGLSFGLANWLSQPWLRALSAQRFDAAQREVASALLSELAQVRKAYIEAVAAQQTLAVRAQSLAGAQARDTLAERMQQAGHWGVWQRQRERAHRSEVEIQHLLAQQAFLQAQEALGLRLGAAVTTPLQLPAALPELPPTLVAMPQLEQFALDQRLDVQAAKNHTAALAEQLGWVRGMRLVNVLALDVKQERGAGPPHNGLELRLELPLFDTGSARIAQAWAQYRQGLAQAAQTGLRAASEVRVARRVRELAHRKAQLIRDQLLPARQAVLEESLLRYNGMLTGVFELLEDSRARSQAEAEAIAAQRDFWLAQVDLELALFSPSAVKSPAAGSVGSPAAGPSSAGH
jgi:outer membrane protein TolC